MNGKYWWEGMTRAEFVQELTKRFKDNAEKCVFWSPDDFNPVKVAEKCDESDDSHHRVRIFDHVVNISWANTLQDINSLPETR